LKTHSPERERDPTDRKNSSTSQDSGNGLPPKGRPRRQKELCKEVRTLKTEPKKGEAQQTERTLQTGRILKMDSSKGRLRRQKELFEQVRILNME